MMKFQYFYSQSHSLSETKTFFDCEMFIRFNHITLTFEEKKLKEHFVATTHSLLNFVLGEHYLYANFVTLRILIFFLPWNTKSVL